MRGPRADVAAIITGPRLRTRQEPLIPLGSHRGRKEELRKCGVKDGDVLQRAAENRAEGVANGALVDEIDDVERARGVVQLAGPDVEVMLQAQRLTECREILGQAGEGVHQRLVEPNPKSVSRLYPPDARLADASPSIGSSAA
jgi:hypothetical protein